MATAAPPIPGRATRPAGPAGPAGPGAAPVPRGRPGTSLPAASRGFRAGLALSLLVHGAVLAALAAGDPGAAPPPPRIVAAAVEEAIPFDPDPPPADLQPPEDLPLPPETVDDLEPIEAAPDPRFAGEDEPPGDADAHIGIAVPGGTNRPVPGGRRRAVGRTDTPPAPTVDPAAMPAPAPAAVREPIREPARRAPGLCPPPRYPERERSRGVEGSLRLRVEVAADGSVTAVTVEESSGSAALDAAAVEAVRAWRFLPGTLDGVPVASVAFQPVSFRLEASR